MKKELTDEIIQKLISTYESNKEELQVLEEFIEEHGETDEGVSNVTESFEQGYNNALEYVFKILGIEF